MPSLVNPETSRRMRQIKGKNTTPELRLRKAVFATGVRFRIHDRSIPGVPDISHKGAKVAVFVDGCFWHGCPRHYTRPASRQEFWDAKLAYNRQRRKVVTRQLVGWKVIQAWECWVADSPERQAARVAAAIRNAKVAR